MIGRRTRGELIGEGKGLLLRHDGRLTAALRGWGREQNLERNGGSKRNKTMSAKSEVGRQLVQPGTSRNFRVEKPGLSP